MTRDSAAERDLARYEQAYGEHAFEAVQAAMRKRMLLELLERLQPACAWLEVGCGLDSSIQPLAVEPSCFVIAELGSPGLLPKPARARPAAPRCR